MIALNTQTDPDNIKNLIFVAGSYEIPVNKSLIDLANSGDFESLNLMMKWGMVILNNLLGATLYRKS